MLVGNPEEKRPLGRPRRRWVVNNKMDLRKIGWGGIGFIDLPEDSDQFDGSCEHGNKPSDSLECWEVLE
jgi:hypothetical protein